MTSTALGLLEKSAAWSEEAFALANARGHAFSIAWAGLSRLRSLRPLGRDAEAILIGNGAVEICERHGFVARLGNVLVYRGAARFAIGERQEGLADMRHGIALWRRTSGTLHITQWISEFVSCLLQVGRTEEAERALQEAEEIIEKTDEQSHFSEIRRLRGQLHEEAGDKERASVFYQQALEWSHAHHAKLFELRASTSLARLWSDQGKRTEARDLLGPVYNWFTEGFDAPDLKEARALLAELT
jgi:tetratricopeptide (TPR) repeat protein